MLVTRRLESTNKLGSGRRNLCGVSNGFGFFWPGKITPKSLNRCGGYQRGWSPNKCLEEGERSNWRHWDGNWSDFSSLPSLLRCAALISVPAISCTNFLCATIYIAHYWYYSISTRAFSYLCRQYDGLAPGCKWHPNYPIHQLGFTEFERCLLFLSKEILLGQSNI